MPSGKNQHKYILFDVSCLYFFVLFVCLFVCFVLPLKERKVVSGRALDGFWGAGSVLYLDPGAVTFTIIYEALHCFIQFSARMSYSQ